MSLLESQSHKNELAKPSSQDRSMVTHGCAYVNHRVWCGLHLLRKFADWPVHRKGQTSAQTSLLTVTIPALTQMKLTVTRRPCVK